MTFVNCNVLFSWVRSYANVIANTGCYTEAPSVRLKKLVLNLCFQSIQKLKKGHLFCRLFLCELMQNCRRFEIL